MRKYLLPIMFLAFWSCEEEAEVLPEDCLGVEGGTALVDSCGVCDSDPTNDCTEDCSGQWGGTLVVDCNGECGGTALVDSCGVCDSDSTNNCAEDCAGVWGGDNICGCTDASASNFDSDATFDDGTCFICEVEMEVLMDFPFSSQLQEYINAVILGESYEFSSDWKANCEAYFIFYQELFDNNCFQDDPYITQESIDDMVSEICTLND